MSNLEVVIERLKNRLEGVSEAEQEKTILDFIKPPEIKVGDRITRNKSGEARYIGPLDGQVGIVAGLLPAGTLDKEGVPVNAELAFVTDTNTVSIVAVDLRYFRKVEK